MGIQCIAKYLPIKEESPLKFTESGYLKEQEIVYDGNRKPFLVGKDKSLIPVKLFAVTQDIEVGDEVISEEEVYKILGEISPRAVWVKNGDEIEIKGYKICLECGMFIDLGHRDNCKISEGNKTMYWIKCPTCKTYH